MTKTIYEIIMLSEIPAEEVLKPLQEKFGAEIIKKEGALNKYHVIVEKKDAPSSQSMA